MDIGYAPGPTAFDTAINTMFGHRANTTVVSLASISSIRGLVRHLNNRSPQSVVNNILIGSHGDDNAYMAIQLHEAFGAHTTYEDLINEMNSSNRSCQIEDPVISPRPTDAGGLPIPPLVLIKGCRVGQSLPYLNKIRDAINGLSATTVQVVAPKFYEVLGPQPQGTFEFYYYDFHHFSKTRITDKAALVAIMAAKNLTDIAGVAVPTSSWVNWIPRRIHRNNNNIQQVSLGASPIPAFTVVPAGRYKYSFVTVFTYNITLASGTIPSDTPGRIALINTQVANLAANPGTSMMAQSLVATHPFPFYQRYGYANMNDLIDDLAWSFSPNPHNALNMMCTGQRHEYNINAPIVTSGTNNLIYNYYANPASNTTSVANFIDTDPRFFVKTT